MLRPLSLHRQQGSYHNQGGEHAFNEFAGFVVGWMMIVANLIAAAAVSIGFAHYLRHFIDLDLRLRAMGLLLIVTIVIVGGDVIREDNNGYGGAVNIASRISGCLRKGAS